MTPTHRPSDATLSAFAAGTLDEGRALVVAVHLAMCEQSRAAVRRFESLGAVALEDAEPAPLARDALARALERISEQEQESRRVPVRSASDLPAPLAAYPLKNWRWIGPGIHYRPVSVAEGTHVFMLKVAPGKKIPDHEHTGTEWSCILQGALRQGDTQYGPGDFEEADDSVDHHQIVDDGAECICIVALNGELRFKGWLGRLMQPLSPI